MRIMHEACVVTLGEQDDPWRTERRSSGWMVGDAPPVESDTPQPAEDPWKTERPRSDWNVGDTPFDETDAMRLALVPVERSWTPSETTGSHCGQRASSAAGTTCTGRDTGSGNRRCAQ
jgi:hypothetical protein